MGRDFFSGPRRELSRGPDERPGTGEFGVPRDPYGYEYGSEGAGRNSRIDSLMEEMSKQLGESERILSGYEGGKTTGQLYGLEPDEPTELTRGPDERPGTGEFFSADEDEPSPVRPGGMSALGRSTPPSAPQHREVGAPRFSPPQRPATRGGRAVREPARIGMGGNTAMRLERGESPGFGLLKGAAGGAGGTAGGEKTPGRFPENLIRPDWLDQGEVARFRRRMGR